MSFENETINIIVIESDDDDSEPELKHVEVFLRLKGIPSDQLYTINNNVLVCTAPETSQIQRKINQIKQITKTFSFTKIFNPDTSQLEIFNTIIKAKVLNFINGRNCTILSYGASGSGKTFTMVGTPDEPGIIPRALEYIFRTIPNLSQKPKIIQLPNGEVRELDDETYQMGALQKSMILNATHIDRNIHLKTYKQMQQRLSSESVAEVDDCSNTDVTIWISFAEIYNEQIFDLLKSAPQRGQQRPRLRLGATADSTYIKDLTSIHVSSGIEAFQVLQYGTHNLKYAATSVNSHSSRSHCIFTIKLIQSSEIDRGAHVSSFHFCDLAGSERVKRTLNVGDRLKESNNINTSLLVLGRCIKLVRDAQQLKDKSVIPFRESKLTQLFQNALMGNEDMMMIVNINPSQDAFDESQHVLAFSAIAREVFIEEHPKNLKPKTTNRFSLYLEKAAGSNQALDNEKDREINRLKMCVSELYNELELQKQTLEEEWRVEKKFINTEYQKFLREERERYEKRNAAALNNLREKYEQKISELRNYYSDLLQDQEDIIVLDSSSEDENTSADNHNLNIISEQSELIRTLQIELNEVKLENEKLRKDTEEMYELKKQIKAVVEEYNELKITLAEATQECLELQKKIAHADEGMISVVTEIVQEEENV
ncbi:hypothetical protein NQ315_006794 [Exocentrus adspersus]|uniref:Kinesin-like protein n=1 Tax=Exocentrus adspersus TaxID=1586481 RepID=A0AAV8WBL4_9CUCU|nr:hypothetical protein NQ315_006794 [Exocentrus adspersus]